MTLTSHLGASRLVVSLLLAGAFAGCAVLPSAEIRIDGATHAADLEAARISIHPGKPVLIRAVDERLLPSIQVSNYLRPITYVLPPGEHVLWLSEPPAGVPFLPQRVSCYVMRATLVANTAYVLELNKQIMLPTLRKVSLDELDSVGVVVDRPLLIERGCKWQ
jgi:hypothetical protein